MDDDGRNAARVGASANGDLPLTPHEVALLEAALDYVRAGLPVFPCHAPLPGGSGKRCTCAPDADACPAGKPGKHPRTANGLHSATVDEGLVRGWWAGAWRGSNVAIVAPKWGVILDIDVGAGHGDVNGFELLDALEAEHGELPDGPRTWTGSRGAHCLFRLPDGVAHGNESGALPKGLDIRGGGRGYIIAPPSLHSSGNAYRWQVMRSIHDVEIPEIPGWLLELIQRGVRAKYDGDAFDLESLPTEVPERIKRVLAAARASVRKVVRMPTGHISSIVLGRCPACGDTRGKCHVTPSGRLRSKREMDCPAGPRDAGDLGIPLVEWVGRYAPEATGALKIADDRAGYDRPKADRLSIALAELALMGDHDVGIGAWLWASGMCLELRAPVYETGLMLWADPDGGNKTEHGRNSGGSRLARAIAASQPDAEHVLIGMRDVNGAVRLGSWVSGTGEMKPLGVRGLESAADMPDGLPVLGDLPGAVAAGAAGRHVVVTVGALDHLTAVGLICAGALDAETVGAPRLRDLAPLLTRLRREWTKARVICPRVTIVAPHGKGEQIDAAVRALTGRAGIAVALPTVRTPLVRSGALAGMAALHWSAADFGAESAARQIRTAPIVSPVPIDIADAGDAVRESLLRAVRESLMITTHGRRRLVIFQVDPGVGKTTAMLRLAAEIASGTAPISPPINGRRPAHVDDDAWPPQGRRVGFWLANHSLADQKLAEATGRLDLGSVCAWERLKGALEWCTYRDRVRLAYPVVGRRGICGDPDGDERCPEADMGCPGAREPSISFGSVALGSHAMAANVRQDLAVIDEDPGVLDDVSVGEDEIASLFASRILPRVKSWRTSRNPDAGNAARLFAGVAKALADQHAQAVASGFAPPHARHVLGDELASAINMPDFLASLGLGFGDDAPEPPVPGPNELRAGSAALASYPSRAAFRTMRELLAWWRRRGEKAGEALVVLGSEPRPPKPVASLEIRPDRTWALHIVRPRRLPDCPVIVLDATGDLAVDRWRAAFPDRDVRVVPMAVAGPPPAIAIHLKTQSLSRKASISTDGQLTQDGVRRFRAAVLRALAASRKADADAARAKTGTDGAAGAHDATAGRRSVLGVLTYKRICDLATGARAPETVDEHRILGLTAELADMQADVVWGYFGRDDRATNRFEAVDALAVIGDPAINLGALEVQGHALGRDAGQIGDSLTLATLIQAVFRARHTRPNGRAVVVVIAGRVAPHIAGMDWQVEPLLAAGRPTSDARALADAMVRHVASETGDVIGLRVVRWWEFTAADLGRDCQAKTSDDDLRRACEDYAADRGLTRLAVAKRSDPQNACFVVFAPTENAWCVANDSWNLL